MAELPTGALEVAVEVGAIASAVGSIEERAEAVLHALGRVVPFQAAQIALVNSPGSEPVSLVVHGYGDAVRAYFNSAAVVEEYELLGLDRSRQPMRLRDLPVAPAEVRGWAEYLAPAGYREGLAVGLHTPDGRYIGILGLNTDTVAHPTVAARDLIGMLAPVIAHAVDPLRSIAAAARLIHDARAGIVLTRSGGVLALPGLPTHPLLSEGSAVLGLAARFASGRAYASFLCPHPGEPAKQGHVGITVLACRPWHPHHPAAAVVASPPGDLRGLTPRELQLLGLLVEGWSNRRIATALVVAQRTVATHIEHILAKLDARSRALATARALNQGTYVPRQLTRTYEGGSQE
jgi:DNA-binding CsgD family transcriptional regulator